MSQLPLADEALLNRISEGDSDALLILHQRYKDLVYGLALRMMGDAHLAEEVTQDVFIKLWRKSRTFDPARGLLRTWLFGITRFTAIDRLRHEGCSIPSLKLQDEEAENAPYSAYFHGDSTTWELRYEVRLLLDQLPAGQRQALELVFFGGMSHSELADYLGLPLGTVKGRVRSGLQRMRALWLDEPVGLRLNGPAMKAAA